MIAALELRQECEATGLAGRRARLAGKDDVAGDRRIVVGGADRGFDIPAPRRIARVRRDRERVGDAAAGNAARIEAAVRIAESDARQQGGIEAALHPADEPGRARVEVVAVAVAGEGGRTAERGEPLLHRSRYLGRGSRPLAHRADEELARADRDR